MLGKFSFMPRLPAGWHAMSLQHIQAFGGDWGIDVKDRHVVVTKSGKVVKDVIWDGVQPIIVN